MRIIIQRVSKASVTIDGVVRGQINQGIVALVGFGQSDCEAILDKVIDKMVGLRIFADENGNTNLSLEDVKGGILAISQFTLYADIKKGRRPSFIRALGPEAAKALNEEFLRRLAARYQHGPVETGEFGAMMDVALTNAGPVTIILDSDELGIVPPP